MRREDIVQITLTHEDGSTTDYSMLRFSVTEVNAGKPINRPGTPQGHHLMIVIPLEDSDGK